jgi:hypothetical protein
MTNNEIIGLSKKAVANAQQVGTNDLVLAEWFKDFKNYYEKDDSSWRGLFKTENDKIIALHEFLKLCNGQIRYNLYEREARLDTKEAASLRNLTPAIPDDFFNDSADAGNINYVAFLKDLYWEYIFRKKAPYDDPYPLATADQYAADPGPIFGIGGKYDMGGIFNGLKQVILGYTAGGIPYFSDSGYGPYSGMSESSFIAAQGKCIDILVNGKDQTPNSISITGSLLSSLTSTTVSFEDAAGIATVGQILFMYKSDYTEAIIAVITGKSGPGPYTYAADILYSNASHTSSWSCSLDFPTGDGSANTVLTTQIKRAFTDYQTLLGSMITAWTEFDSVDTDGLIKALKALLDACITANYNSTELNAFKTAYDTRVSTGHSSDISQVTTELGSVVMEYPDVVAVGTGLYKKRFNIAKVRMHKINGTLLQLAAKENGKYMMDKLSSTLSDENTVIADNLVAQEIKKVEYVEASGVVTGTKVYIADKSVFHPGETKYLISDDEDVTLNPTQIAAGYPLDGEFDFILYMDNLNVGNIACIYKDDNNYKTISITNKQTAYETVTPFNTYYIYTFEVLASVGSISEEDAVIVRSGYNPDGYLIFEVTDFTITFSSTTTPLVVNVEFTDDPDYQLQGGIKEIYNNFYTATIAGFVLSPSYDPNTAGRLRLVELV